MDPSALFDEDDPLLLDEMDEDTDDFLDAFHPLVSDDGRPVPLERIISMQSSMVSLSSSSQKRAADKASKKRKCNPDADAIAAVTEESMKALNIDMESKDAKKMRRQIRNRLSAQFHRDRKNAHMKGLEDALADKAREADLLRSEVAILREENARLSSLLGKTGRCASMDSCCGSVGGTTDVESVSASPSASPFHQPQYIDTRSPSPVLAGAPVMISSAPQLPPLPLPKALGLVAVLCVLAVCCMGNIPTIAPPMSAPSGAMGPVAQGPASPGRRRLAIIDSTDSQPPSGAKANLRHAPATNYSLLHNASDSAEPLFVRKELVPFDAHTQYWRPRSPAADSLSHIIMQSGVALFDPSLQLVAAAWPPVSEKPFVMTTKDSQAPPAVPATHLMVVPQAHAQAHAQAAAVQALPPPDRERIHVKLEPGVEHPPDQKHWPAVSYQQSPKEPAAAACGDCAAEQRALFERLLSHANQVTLTLPASAVRTGTSLADSQGSTMEGILRMFNLTDSNGAASRGLQSTANAVLELDCVLLSAKLLTRDQ